MFEAAAVSAVVATISLLVNTRSCLETIVQDIDNYDNHDETLPSIVSELSLLTEKVMIWRDLWRIRDNHPADFLIESWGESGSENITTLLRHIENEVINCSQRIAKAFHIKITDREQSYRGDSTGFPSNQPTSAIGPGTKLKNVVFRFGIISKHLKRIREDVDRLQELSILKLRREHNPQISFDNDKELQYWVDTYFTESFLFAVAEMTRSHSQALFQECLFQEHRTRLNSSWLSLTEFTKVPERGDISDETETSIEYDLITQWNRSLFRFIIRVIDRNGLPSRCNQTLHSFGFLDTHGKQNCDCSFKNCMRCFFLYSDDPENFHRLFYDSHSYSTQGSFQNLHTLFTQRSNSTLANRCRPFSTRTRLKLAYQVSVFMFVMLQTSWTSQVCSCRIVFEYEERQLHFRLQVADSDLPGAHQSRARHWCHVGLKASPIKRFGLLLSEIAIAQPFEHVKLDQFANAVEHDFNRQESDQYLKNDIMSRITHQMNLDYAGAVEWCITQEWDLTKDYANAAGEFYSEVLQP